MWMAYFRSVFGDTVKACEAHFYLALSHLDVLKKKCPLGQTPFGLDIRLKGSQNHPDLHPESSIYPYYPFETHIMWVRNSYHMGEAT